MTSPQAPVSSPFGAASTAAEVMEGVELDGRTAVVTGGYSGIGLITARALAKAGARVIVPARDIDRARERLAGASDIELQPMDLIDPDSIEAFGATMRSRGAPVSILINSAGVMAAPLSRDKDGHESQFAINHLGHFRLARTLWPLLVAEGARVVAVSSRGHQIAGVDFDDIDFQRRPYDKWAAYGQSKTANALFAVALDRRGAPEGVRAFSLHPGQILTDLARHLSHDEVAAFDPWDEHGRPVIDPGRGMKTPEQGAATSLWCATSPLLSGMGGVYCEDCDVAGAARPGDIMTKGVVPWATDPEAAERLWAQSEEWTG